MVDTPRGGHGPVNRSSVARSVKRTSAKRVARSVSLGPRSGRARILKRTSAKPDNEHSPRSTRNWRSRPLLEVGASKRRRGSFRPGEAFFDLAENWISPKTGAHTSRRFRPKKDAIALVDRYHIERQALV